MSSSPPLRDASTVILARERNNSLEIYLLKRSTKSGFMDGMYVFPGGTVDEQDRRLSDWQNSIDLSKSRIEQRLCNDTFDAEEALAFGVAAIRETLEEAGVLIASSKGKTQDNFKQMASLRMEKGLLKEWFKPRIQTDNWILLLSSLGCWSHWISPRNMKKRFNTRFFIAIMPDNQTCEPDNIETKHGIWLTPKAALEQNLTAQTPLSPPTVVTLTQLSKFSDLAELKKEIIARPWGKPISPIMLPSDNGPVIIEPWDPEFHSPDRINLMDLDKKVLKPGEYFSRIWCDNGLWKPVGA
ncbi:MAG: hypothetical protein ABFR31_09295 [Thermodesulfobacteriota bacterium]